MASRAERADLPPAPRLSGALRAAAVDFYFQSIRLVGANLIWGAALLVLLFVGAATSPLTFLVLSPLLAVLATGPFRLAAEIVRGEPPDFSDVVDAWRRYGLVALAFGAGLTLAVTVLVVDIGGAARSPDPLAWALATMAGWGLLAVAAYAVAAWPILTDPARDGMPARHRLRLAGLLLAAFPGRMAALAVLTGVILLFSTIAFAALLSISLSCVALVAARYVLPASDRLEARLGEKRDRSA